MIRCNNSKKNLKIWSSWYSSCNNNNSIIISQYIYWYTKVIITMSNMFDVYDQEFNTQCQDIIVNISECRDCAPSEKDRALTIIRNLESQLSGAAGRSLCNLNWIIIINKILTLKLVWWHQR